METLRRDVDELDEMIRGDGNGKPGLAPRVRTLESTQAKVVKMLEEWQSFKDQLKGAKVTIVVIGLLITLAGGGLGIAILTALKDLAAGLP